MAKIVDDERYKKLSDDDKKKAVTQLKYNLRDDIFKQYKFTYKTPKSTSNTKEIKQLIK